MPSVQPMTPAPLPPEEIERLKVALGRYDVEALWCICKKVPALLAEIEAGRAGTERVRDEATDTLNYASPEQIARETDADVQRWSEWFSVAMTNEAGSAICRAWAADRRRIQALQSELAALRQAAPPATRADLAQVGAQPAAAVSKAHANVFRDVEVRWGDRGFGLTVRHRVSGEVLAEIPAGFTLQGLCIRPAVPSDYEAATPPTSGAGDEGSGR